MKKLVAIAVAVIVAVGVFAYLGRSSETPTAAITEPSQSQAPSTEQLLAPAREPEYLQTTLTADAGTRPTPAATLRARCNEAYQREQERQQRAWDAEQKDPAWAYAMEQKLREFTSPRLQAAQIEVSDIDCKTTFCEINAHALVPELAGQFNAVIEAVREQPWSEFSGFSMTNSGDSGKQVQYARLTRRESKPPPTPEEQEMQNACFAAFAEEGNNKRAAMDAEPRDTSWADPTEQLLRQYIVAHTAKHPADKLEITCRTSFCEIKATGRTEEFIADFQKAAQEVASEPWSTVRDGEAGGGTLPDLSGTQQYQVLYRQ
jgi:hypothetical protein